MSTLVPYPVSLPSSPLPASISPFNPHQILSTLLSHLIFDSPSFSSSLAAQQFTPHALWRDLFALTGSLRTFHSPESIVIAWGECCGLVDVKVGVLKVMEESVRVVRMDGGGGAGRIEWIEGKFEFEMKRGRGVGILGVCWDEGDGEGKGGEGRWKIWVMRTILDGLRGCGSVDFLEPGEVRDKRDGERWAGGEGKVGSVEGRGVEGKEGKERKFEAVVIGGGLAGLSTSGRLKALGVKYLIVDKHENVGDNWKLRYGSARLHTNREYAHLPFERTFGPEYQEFLTKDDLAKGYSEWVQKFDINIWQKTTVLPGCTWNPTTQLWTLKLKRGEEKFSIKTSFVVLAGGAGGQEPVLPEPYQDRDLFQGITLHSAEYRDAKEWKGKHGIVIGTANTAHDVAEDMLEADLASVTMIQRSKTYVMPAVYYHKIAMLNYNPYVPTQTADLNTLTNPYAITDLLSQISLHAQARQEPERFDGLEAAGFKTERFGSIQEALLIRAGGHYMDVGASAKIAGGLIKIKSNALPTRYTHDSLLFTDGTTLKADVIVFATGFVGNMRRQVDELFGEEVGTAVGDYWTLDEEGELKGVVRPVSHPAIWLHGGTIGQGRYYSRFVALQIKARLMGIPLPLYERRF